MAGPFDVLHIKGRTAGSSNELSFDVLDAASQGMSDKKKERKKERTPRDPGSPKPSQGSYHGVAGTSTLSAVPEVERRKRARRVQSVRLWVVSVVAVVALISAGVFFGYRIHQDRENFSARFNQLIDRFVEIDQTMVEIDSLMIDPLNSVDLVERAEVADRFAALNRELNAVTAEAGAMADFAPEERDRSALEEVENAATARSEMIADAEGAFTLSKHANQLADAAAKAWSEVLEADSQAREATKLANAANTEAATVEARDKTQKARDLMSNALTELRIVEKEESGIDLSAEQAYVVKRIESLDAAIKTSNALLDNDRAGAKSANDAYNASDREAAALAANLPESPADQVKSAFQSSIDSTLQNYASARSAVTSADSALRSYL